MYSYIHVHIHICTNVYVYTCMYTYLYILIMFSYLYIDIIFPRTHMNTYTNINVCAWKYLHIYKYIYIYVWIYIYIYIYIYIDIFAYTYTHTHIYIYIYIYICIRTKSFLESSWIRTHFDTVHWKSADIEHRSLVSGTNQKYNCFRSLLFQIKQKGGYQGWNPASTQLSGQICIHVYMYIYMCTCRIRKQCWHEIYNTSAEAGSVVTSPEVWMSHVTHEWVMSHINESCHK